AEIDNIPGADLLNLGTLADKYDTEAPAPDDFRLKVSNINSLTSEETDAIVQAVFRANRHIPVKDIHSISPSSSDPNYVTITYKDSSRDVVILYGSVTGSRPSTLADKYDTKAPDDFRLEVANINSLTSEETDAIVQAVFGANRHIPVKDIYSISPSSSDPNYVTITYKDSSHDVVTLYGAVTGSRPSTLADKYDAKAPAPDDFRLKVSNINSLTSEETDAIVQAVFRANRHIPVKDIYSISPSSYNPNYVTITYKDSSSDVVTMYGAVIQKRPEEYTTYGYNPVRPDFYLAVENPDSITEEEKKLFETFLPLINETKNNPLPENTRITVSSDSKVLFNYEDGSNDWLYVRDIVKQYGRVAKPETQVLTIVKGDRLPTATDYLTNARNLPRNATFKLWNMPENSQTAGVYNGVLMADYGNRTGGLARVTLKILEELPLEVAVNQPNPVLDKKPVTGVKVITTNKADATITSNTVNGLKVNAQGQLEGRPTSVTFQGESETAQVNLTVSVSHSTVDRPISKTVT
ncbi:Rib/alpha-like domain-containing protein, partial [Streptococcus pluranimalium]|uniref:Rib/alpha-like domain-containing protein n=1 Tax=Streptococcus pluranimalium TaxID=82348 RepID=UPI0039FDCCEA